MPHDIGFICLYMYIVVLTYLETVLLLTTDGLYLFLKKIKNTCGQRKLIHYAIPSSYEMTGWYKNIYLGLSILCISEVSSKKNLKHS